MMKNIKLLCLSLLCVTVLSCKSETKPPLAIAQNTDQKAPLKKRYIKVALLLDTSNSMDGLIDQAKAQLWEIINELSYAKCKNEHPSLQIALYEYGNDRLTEKSGYTRKIIGFTTDLDEISKELFSLTTNGGSEFCGIVIKSSLDNLDWGNDADDLKMIFIAGNEPFDQGPLDYKDATLQAKEKDVVVNTIFCGKYEHGINTQWKDGAKLAYGDYMAIDQNKETVHIASPYDDIILQLNIKLNNTYIPYGSQGRYKAETQREQDDNAAGYSKANAVNRTVSKSSHLYTNSTWDLVDAEEKKGFRYQDLEKNDLPENLKDKSVSEIKAIVSQQRQKRNEIQEAIAENNLKRRVYIQSKENSNTDNLENAMVRALKKQAEKKDFSWN